MQACFCRHILNLSTCESLCPTEIDSLCQGKDGSSGQKTGFLTAERRSTVTPEQYTCTSVSINERIMQLDVNTDSGTPTLLSICEPTLDYSKQQKDYFYSQLEQIIKIFPARNRLSVLGDVNVHVGYATSWVIFRKLSWTELAKGGKQPCNE
ncbi:hypothetical protein Y1Q_0008159 [Alligator mississippiensis]|uniref:Endonuclease/exonuclease/phosphatase domain-containing protein n=1 Tax=Alligator mississippiensis TaxID=8496 RepID=A0A151N194_ALLMI|nr:hypothetical protein Y1Q_0008159 [Alligator mississippiensis]